MRLMVFVIGGMLIVVPPQLGAQNKSDASQAAVGKQTQQALTKDIETALKTGQFIEEKGEFKLDRRVEAVKGGKSSETVEFQIGTINEKPAFVPVALPIDGRGQSEVDVKAAIADLKLEKLQMPGDTTVQQCAPGFEQVCSVTLDGKCVKYTCEKK